MLSIYVQNVKYSHATWFICHWLPLNLLDGKERFGIHKDYMKQRTAAKDQIASSYSIMLASTFLAFLAFISASMLEMSPSTSESSI